MARRMVNRNKARGTIAKMVGNKVKVRRSVSTSSGIAVYPHSKTYRRYHITKTFHRTKGRGR